MLTSIQENDKREMCHEEGVIWPYTASRRRSPPATNRRHSAHASLDLFAAMASRGQSCRYGWRPDRQKGRPLWQRPPTGAGEPRCRRSFCTLRTTSPPSSSSVEAEEGRVIGLEDFVKDEAEVA
jgi:hypothetical protein